MHLFCLSQVPEVVDETNMVGGKVTTTGQIHADNGQDVPGSYEGTNNFNAGGSLAGGHLTSGGFPVTVSYNPATQTYTGVANGVTVFTMDIDPLTGQYVFELLEPLDHADTADHNDNIEFKLWC